MTRVTTITEYNNAETKTVTITQDTGRSGTLTYKNDEATILIREPGEANEYDTWLIHPDDALVEFLSQFLEF